jgi:acyl-CoA reductase-like NAD-dependent aldehyde dehydrogenase
MIITNPYTEEIRHVDEVADPSEAFSRAKGAAPDWGRLSVESRVDALTRALGEYESSGESFARLIGDEMGKPISGALLEVKRAADEWRYMLDNAPGFLAPELEGGAQVFFEPLGVVAVVSPWNFPFLLPLRAIIPALLAGNSVVFKPSELTPLSGLALSDILSRHAPLEVVVGGKDLGARVVDLPVAAIAFTGSSAVGKTIACEAAKKLKRVSLELGGLDPAIVFSDCDVDQAAEVVVKNNATNSGQVCNAVKRVLVQASVHNRFVERAREVANSLKYGDPRDPRTEVGPLVSAAQLARVRGYLDEALAKGARAHIASVDFKRGYFFPQAILTDVPRSARLLSEEPFGPILPIMSFETPDEAVLVANDIPYGLGASVWSGDVNFAKGIARRLECGVVRINSHGAFGPGVPWGGCKESGIGRMKSKEALREFTNVKAIG